MMPSLDADAMGSTSDYMDNGSVLDDLGAEVTGIAFPVSVCMAITVALVRLLNGGDDGKGRVIIGEAVYGEKEGDSAAEKLGGSLLNALVFVAAITVMTFLIVILFKYGCVKIIYGYMGFSTFLIFFFMTGGILMDVAQRLKIHVDAISFTFFLYNFACVGSVILFFTAAPLSLKQLYLMWVGVVVAFIFTAIPEWTTWVLLVAMSLYDFFAVLTPHGPLQMLVNLSIERDQDIPALVYEAREVRRPRRRAQPQTAQAPTADASAGDAAADARNGEAAEPRALRAGVGPVGEADEALCLIRRPDKPSSLVRRPKVASSLLHDATCLTTRSEGASSQTGGSNDCADPVRQPMANSVTAWRAASISAVQALLPVTSEPWSLDRGWRLGRHAQRRRQIRGEPLGESSRGHEMQEVRHMWNGQQDTGHGSSTQPGPVVETNESRDDSFAAAEPLVPRHERHPTWHSANLNGSPADRAGPSPLLAAATDGTAEGGSRPQNRRLRRRDVERAEGDVEDPYQLGMPSGVKLGLGDFIFYSVLVGRASLYDWMTVYACFISVIAGLGITLWLLAITKKALPALPVSIALGIAFYFLTRWALEPFIVPAFLHSVNW